MSTTEQAAKWDYTTSVLSHGTLGISKGQVNRESLEAELDRMGADGYELVHVWFDMKLHKEKDGHVLIFKRAR